MAVCCGGGSKISRHDISKLTPNVDLPTLGKGRYIAKIAPRKVLLDFKADIRSLHVYLYYRPARNPGHARRAGNHRRGRAAGRAGVLDNNATIKARNT